MAEARSGETATLDDLYDVVRQAVRDEVAAFMGRALGVTERPPHAAHTMTAGEAVAFVNSAGIDALDDFEAGERSRQSGPRDGVMAVIRHRRRQLAAANNT